MKERRGEFVKQVGVLTIYPTRVEALQKGEKRHRAHIKKLNNK